MQRQCCDTGERMRTHNCGELRKKDDKKKVTLCGWNHRRRDHGGLIFVDLRDRYGLIQVVFDPKLNKEVHKTAEKLSREDVIQVSGVVRPRGKKLENPNLGTGEIEVAVDKLHILAKAKTLPIEIDDRVVAGEDVRLKYRYLDLRRPIMQRNLRVRHETAQAAREFLSNNGFLEVETPLLIASTPEGARDYVVPSRVHPGKFYSLPQSPQLYKQLLMYAGVDRYFQLARCLRDEDLRQDRQPEHTQIDLEMSFVTVEDLLDTWERLFQHMWKKVLGINLKLPFPRFTYEESMERFGTDKPDIRFGLELIDVSDELKKCDFSVFTSVVKEGGVVRCINPEKDFSRKELDELIKFCQTFGAKGMAYLKVSGKKLEGSIAKYFKDEVQKKILAKTKAKKGYLLFIADKPKIAYNVLGRLRNKLGKELKLYDKNEFSFCYVIDFPLFEWNEDEKKWNPAHHMFCQPKEEYIKDIESDPGKILCTQYDLSLNGIELGSGSIRITNSELQEKVMKVVGYSKEKAERNFGFLLEAFKYGSPPHGGIGIGFDRIVALMLGYNDIREVIAFPKTKSAEGLVDNSPRELEDKQMKELHIKLDFVKKK